MHHLVFRLTVLSALLGGALFAVGPAPVFAEGCADLNAEVFTSDACNAEMAAYPTPNAVPLEPNPRALAQFTFMRIGDPEDEEAPVPIYDAPGGQPLGVMDPGFTFVAIRGRDGVWIEINEGEWVNEEYLTYQYASQFAGVQVADPANWTRPFAWILINTYTAAYPGGPQIIDRARLHYRYDLVNIYATINVDGHHWYLIAPDEWVYHTWIAMARPIPRPAGVAGRWVAVDLYEQTLVAYDNDTPLFATLVSSGLPDWSTREGLFTVWARLLYDHMRGGEVGQDFYSLENVPYTMYFDGDISLHGTYWHNGFGYRHSHGCVNLTITDAEWLFNWTNSEEYRHFQVYVYYSARY